MRKQLFGSLLSALFRHDFTPGGSPLSPAFDEEIPTVDALWSALFQPPFTAYRREIALIAAHLSEAAETGDGGDITARYRDYGFPSDGVAVGNYRRNTGGAMDIGRGKPSLAFAVGCRPLNEDSALLAVTARGAVNVWELYRALTTDPVCPFRGLAVYDVVSEFADELSAGLHRYLTRHRELSGKRLLLLLAGHSLGGAAVNLLAARWLEQPPEWTDRRRIVCYTFGAVDVFDGEKASHAPVIAGFEAIHNVYNEEDDFGPVGHGLYGIPPLMAKGCHQRGKFGYLYTFDRDYRKIRKSASPNHDMCVYLSALRREGLFW